VSPYQKKKKEIRCCSRNFVTLFLERQRCCRY